MLNSQEAEDRWLITQRPGNNIYTYIYVENKDISDSEQAIDMQLDDIASGKVVKTQLTWSDFKPGNTFLQYN